MFRSCASTAGHLSIVMRFTLLADEYRRARCRSSSLAARPAPLSTVERFSSKNSAQRLPTRHTSTNICFSSAYTSTAPAFHRPPERLDNEPEPLRSCRRLHFFSIASARCVRPSPPSIPGLRLNNRPPPGEQVAARSRHGLRAIGRR